MNPLIQKIQTYVEKPKTVVLIDNSVSVGNVIEEARASLFEGMGAISNALTDNDYEVVIRDLNGSLEGWTNIEFSEKATNLYSSLSEIQTEYENSNLTKVILVSDGIYNQGASPAYTPFDFKVYTVGVGDTIQKDDLVLKNVLFNKISYAGRKAPIIAEVVNYGFKDKSSMVEIWKSGKLVSSKEVAFEEKTMLQRIEMEVMFESVGLQSLVVIVKPLDGEGTDQNNSKRIFVDVVDGKQKILLLAPAPHPDLKAISAVIEQNENFELVKVVAGIDSYKDDDYDLAIIHQAYERRGALDRYISNLREKKVPMLLIMGSRANMKKANDAEKRLNFVQNRNQRDNVSPAVNQDFEAFSISGIETDAVQNFPPVVVPYGEFNLPVEAKVLFYQKVGSIVTGKPLLFFSDRDDVKVGYMMATGFWKWRLQEYAINEKTEVFDALFLKSIQYLSTKLDKRKFRFEPVKNEFLSNETIEFQAELYNDIFERVYNRSVSVKIRKDGQVYQEASFTPVSSFSNLELTGFEEGSYQYEALVELNDKKEYARGAFVVKELQLEVIDQVADFDMLRLLSSNSGGSFYSIEDLPQLVQDSQNFKDTGLIDSNETVLPMINIRWLLLLIIALLSLEWLTRKYHGGY